MNQRLIYRITACARLLNSKPLSGRDEQWRKAKSKLDEANSWKHKNANRAEEALCMAERLANS